MPTVFVLTFVAVWQVTLAMYISIAITFAQKFKDRFQRKTSERNANFKLHDNIPMRDVPWIIIFAHFGAAYVSYHIVGYWRAFDPLLMSSGGLSRHIHADRRFKDVYLLAMFHMMSITYHWCFQDDFLITQLYSYHKAVNPSPRALQEIRKGTVFVVTLTCTILFAVYLCLHMKDAAPHLPEPLGMYNT